MTRTSLALILIAPVAMAACAKQPPPPPAPILSPAEQACIDEGAQATTGAPAAAPAEEAAESATNPAGAGENPALRGDDHAPEPETEEAHGGDTVMTLSPVLSDAMRAACS